MAVSLKIKDLAPGTVFNAGPIDVRVLEHRTNGTTLVIADTCIADRHFADQPFKLRPEKLEHNPNDWRFSSLRKELNTDFLESFDIAEGPVRTKNIVAADWNLEDHNGGEGYGVIQDKVGLLTQSMFEKYSEQDLLKLDDWWWLCTPIAGNAYGARNVYTDGSRGFSGAYGGGYGVRPAFFVESGIEIVLEEDEVNLSDSALLEGFTTRQLVEELFRRADRNESLLDQEDEDYEGGKQNGSKNKD